MRKLYADNKLVFLKDTNRALPVGFTEVEYLQSTGTQYIDIGINAKSTLKTDIHFEVVDKTQGGHIFGGRTVTSGGRGYGVYLPTSGGIGFDYETRLTSNVSTTNGYKYRVVKDGASNTLYVNGVQSYTGNNTAATFDLNVKMALFYMKDSNTPFNASVKCKVFYFKIWDNGVLVRDFIPCLDNTNTPCMYDLVSKKPYYNQGTGEFTYGREIHYTKWLESTGTQYINTGVYLTNNHSVEIDYQLTVASQSRKGLYGGLVANGARHGALTSPSNQYLEAGYGSTNVYYQLGLPDTKRHVLKQAKNELYFDGKLVYTFNAATFTQNFTAPLGNFNYTNYAPLSAKYYGSRWWDGDTLVRDFQPAIDENGLGFWFDRVTHTCFLNAGTGDFKYAAVECEYLEVTGLGTSNNRPCLDLGIKYKSSMSIEGKYTRTAMGDSGSILPLSTSTTNPVLYFPALNANAKTDRFVWRRGGYNEQNYYYSFSDYPVTIDFKLDAVNDALYVNGSKVKTGMIASMNGYSSPYESASNLCMLSISGNYGGLGKVYPLKIYDTTQVYRDLIPAWKDGSYGMYDKEHDVLYTNIKGGTIVMGKIKDKRPSAIRLIKD